MALKAKLEELFADPKRLSAMRLTARTTFDKWFSETSPLNVIEYLAPRMVRQNSQGARESA